MKKLYILLFVTTISFFSSAQLSITEFIANPNNSDADREWIELYNYSGNPVNLRGWTLEANSGAYTVDITNGNDYFVEPNDYVILASNKSIFETEWLGGNTSSKVINYNSLTITNAIGNLSINNFNAGGFYNYSIDFTNDNISGMSTFLDPNSGFDNDALLGWEINRNGNDTLTIQLSGVVYILGYENSGHTNPITSTNGDTGTPLSGGYSTELALAGSCLNPYQLTCGVSFSGDNANGENNIYNYDCATQNEYGYETFHEFTLTQPSDIVISLTGMTTADLDVHLVSANSCDGTGCIARHDNTITQTALAAGTYFIAVDGYGTRLDIFSSYDLLITCTPNNTTSLKEQELASNIKIFPNPSNGTITITSNENIIENIHVLDMSGRIIPTNQTNNFQNISLDNVVNGFYFVIIETNNGIVTKKITISK